MKIQEQTQEEQKRSIPSDVIMDILSRIPARSVMRFRCVSKFWYSLTHDPYFVDMHLSRAEKLTPALLVEEFFFVEDSRRDISRLHLHSLAVDNSEFATPKAFATIDIKKPVYHLSPPCNGLIICDNGDEGIDVINLTTQESITIFKSPIGKGHLDFIRLTFHSSTKEYKLVRYSYSDNEPDLHSGYRFEVLTLGSDAWRVISDDLIVIGDDIICVNGTMYFLFTEDNLDDDQLVPSHVALMSLDLGDEKFKPVKLPPCCDHPYYMDVLNGNLCIMVASRGDNAFMMDIWVMKEKDQSWSKDYAIRIEDPDKSLDSQIKFVTLRGQEVFLYFYGPRRGLWCFHLGNQSARKIELEKIDCVDLICTYVETLVSLDKFKK